MDSPPAKRRRLSPAPSAVTDAPTVDPLPTLQNHATSLTPTRPSFLSPTRASLSRSNPNLLPQPQTGSRSRPTSRGNPMTDRAPLFPPRSSTAEPVPTTAEAASGNTDLPARHRTASPVRTSTGLGGTYLSSSPRRPTRASGRLSSPSKGLLLGEEAPDLGPGSTVPGLQTIQEPVNATAPIRTAVGGTEENNPAGTRATQSGVRRIADANDGAADPDLSPSSSGRALLNAISEKHTTGLLNSPSRRPKRRRRSEAEAVLSPDPPDTPGARLALRSRKGKDGGNRPPASPSEPPTDPAEADGSEALSNAEREQEQDRLRAQLRLLQDEVEHCEAELRFTRDQETAPVPPIPQPSPSSFLSAFLPFASRPRPPPTLGPTAVPDSPPPSHHPLAQKDPLPYLRVFTPLTFDSTLAVLEKPIVSGKESQRPYLEQTITVSSPSALFRARLSLIIDTDAVAAQSVKLVQLSNWSEAELGTWLRGKVERDAVAGRDVSSLCWAMARYWELAEQRTRFWNRCKKEYSELLKHDRVSFGEDDNLDPILGPSSLGHGADLGRSELVFQQRGRALLVAWQIVFDWTGEAQSRVTAQVSVPPSCKLSDHQQPRPCNKGGDVNHVQRLT
ncbi:MAG: hypothetical protein M1817_002935 [Caeruleum heppii]|nr:MAG: hypothetical protein M1817_002935 [Caeruleum heppii]